MQFKHQEHFASELYQAWLEGKDTHVRTVIRGLKNSAQSAYVAAHVATLLYAKSADEAVSFCTFIHPNNK